MEKIINIGNDRQLFLDHQLCADSENVKLIMNQPLRTGEVLLQADEQERRQGLSIGAYCSVLQENGLTRLWYYANSQVDHDQRRLCYAESKDGWNFQRPVIDPRKNHGLQPANAVIGDPVQGGCVWIDPKAPQNQRYRTQAKWGPPGKYAGKGDSLHFYASPDGIEWAETHYLHIGDCDTQTVVFFDRLYDRYVMYTRDWERLEDHNLNYRKVRRLESDDLVNWNNERVVWEADAEDLARYQTSVGKSPVDYYGACVFKYPEAGNFYIMLTQPFWHWQDRPEHEKWGFSPDPQNLDRQVIHLGPAMIDARLSHSRDGVRFHHAIDRGPFLGVGPNGDFDSRRIWILPQPIVQGKNIRFYYAGGNQDHDGFIDSTATEKSSGIGCAIMRRDGFVSAEADYHGGWLTTPALSFKPGRLELNVAAAAGGAVRVEILDHEKQPIPGFSGNDSNWQCGDSICLPVGWTRDEVEQLAERPVHLKFHLREAKLYSFRFVPSRISASNA